MRLLYQPPVARLLGIVAVVYFLAYLAWRLSASLNPAATVFSIVFFAAEASGFLSFALYLFVTWDVDQRARFELRPDLAVDVYVPAYDEDLDVLEATLIGCGAMSYPHLTYVLDDGHRQTVAMLAARLGCRYVTRSANVDFKAGNLNAALPETEGELIVVLDADTVPQPDLLDRTLGYFVDDRVAVVQLPQEFYNLDSVQHEATADGAMPWHDLAMFFRVIQAGKNRWNAATWSGSPAILRRSAIEAIGGVPVDTSDEELQASVRLHGRGWKTVYHDEALTYGIAAETVQAFSTRRERRARGSMELLRSRDNPLFFAGLTPEQRFSYLASILPYFGPYQKLVYLLTPVLIVFTGVFPLRVSAIEYLLHWFPCFALTLLASVALGRGNYSFSRVQKYDYLKIFAFLRATASLVGKKRPRERANLKTVGHEIATQERRYVLPHLVFVAIEVIAVGAGVVELLWVRPAVASLTSDVALALIWALANAAILWMSVRVAWRRFYRRERYRFPVDLTANVRDRDQWHTAATVQDLSLYGVGLVADEAIEVGQFCAVTLDLPSGQMTVRGDVVSQTALADGRWRLGIQFILFAPEDRSRLIAFLFVIAPRIQRSRVGLPFGTLTMGDRLSSWTFRHAARDPRPDRDDALPGGKEGRLAARRS